MDPVVAGAVRNDIEPITPPLVISSSSHLRRTTCDLCRERKVRCDRTKPNCLRCRNLGTVCTYPSADGDAAKLAKALQVVHSRLQQAEARLQTQGQLMPNGPPPTGTSSPPSSSTAPVQIAFPLALPTARTPSLDSLSLQAGVDLGLNPSGFPSSWEAEPTSPNIREPSLTSSTSGFLGGYESRARHSASLECGTQQGFPLSEETFQRLSETYFAVVQKHLALVNRQEFERPGRTWDTHQSRALRYAVCMSGAHASIHPELRNLAQKCYRAARYHLEETELECDDSSPWTLEAAQALILVARHELTHVSSPRALITIARLNEVLPTLGNRLQKLAPAAQDDTSFLPRFVAPGGKCYNGQAGGEDAGELRRTYLLGLALGWRKSSALFTRGWESSTQQLTAYAEGWQPPSRSSSDFAMELSTQLCAGLPRILANGSADDEQTAADVAFGHFISAVHVASLADRHHFLTMQNYPSYNYCQEYHEIETKITSLVSSMVALPLTVLFTGPAAETHVLALLTALAARIQLYHATALQCRRAKILDSVLNEVRRQNMATANDISDVLSNAKMLDASKIAFYREASFWIMPALALAAEALRVAAPSLETDSSGTASPASSNASSTTASREVRASLETICRAMEECKGDASHFDHFIVQSRSFLENLQLRMRLRTDIAMGDMRAVPNEG